MKYFKVMWGFDDEHSVPIDETELEKAIFAHMRGLNVAFQYGSVSGDKIIAVQPDYHRAMGWNKGYKLGSDDYEELAKKGIDIQHHKFLAKTKEKVQYLVDTKQEHLIGKNTKIIEPNAPKPFSEDVNKLADKFRIK